MKRFGLLFCLFVVGSVMSSDEKSPHEKKRAEILKNMQKVMGDMPDDSHKVPLDVKVISEEKLEGYIRKKITYAVEKNDRVPAWLLIPLGKEGKRPAMLCLHQTINIGKDEPVGLGKQESKQQALHLVKRGYVCLVPDYPSFGEYPYDFSKSAWASGSLKAIWNNMRGIDYLCTLDFVDPERIGVIGHSLGGHNSMFTAAFDTRLKVTVSSCGFTSFAKYYNGNLKGWTSARYMPRIASVYDSDPKKMPFDFHDVITAIAPRAFLAVSPIRDSNFEVSGVKDVIQLVEPIYKNLKASDKLRAIYPDSGHDFPEEGRKVAYEFLDQILKP